MSQPAVGSNKKISGISTMPRSNFRLAQEVPATTSSHKQAELPQGVRRNVRVKQASSDDSKKSVPPAPKGSPASRKPVKIAAADLVKFKNLKSFGDVRLLVETTLISLQYSLKNNDIKKTFELVQAEKKNCAWACGEMEKRAAKNELSPPVAAAYELFKLLVEAPDVQSLFNMLEEAGLHPDDPSKVSKTDASKLLRENVNTLAEDAAKFKAPKPDPEAVNACHGPLRKLKIQQVLNTCFDAYLPVLDVEVDDQGRLTRIKVNRTGFRAGRKWIAIDWNNDLPEFRATPKRLQAILTSEKIGEKWNDFAGEIKKYDCATRVKESKSSAGRLNRATQAWNWAAELLPFAKPKDKKSYLRGDVQQMKYEVADKSKFRKAYQSGSLLDYFRDMGEDELTAHIPGLLVESFADFFQMMAGRISMEQMVELIQLFPENPPFAQADHTHVGVENKEPIRQKLKELLGDQYQLIGSMFGLTQAFFSLAGHQLEEDFSKYLSKNCWGTYMAFFGFSNSQFDVYLKEKFPGFTNSDRESLVKKVSTMAYQLPNNVGDYFDLKLP